MYKTAKKQMSKALAGLLAALIMLSLIPTELYVVAFATEIDQYTVKVIDKEQPIDKPVSVTLTDKEDASKTMTKSTENGVAVFKNFVNVGSSYTVSVAPVVGYENVNDYELLVKDGESETTVQLTALEKVKISGVVKDENEKPYEGATIKLSGYFEATTKTDKNGQYSFDVFKGEDYTLTVTAKEKKYSVAEKKFSDISEDKDYTVSLAVKEYKINTNAGANGNITKSMTGVKYGDKKVITAKANDGFCIGELKVNGDSITEAKGLKSYEYTINNIAEDYDISVTFIRKTYKIKFTVGENGEVSYSGGKDTISGGSVEIGKEFEESTDPKKPTKVIVTATPAQNYRVSKVVVDGTTQDFTENDKKYSEVFEINKDHTFEVEFKINNTFTVETKDGQNGTSSVDKAVVDYNGSAAVTIRPDTGYNIEKVTINEAETTDYAINDDESSYTLNINNITKNTKVVVEYSEIPSIAFDNVVINSSDALKKIEDKDVITYIYAHNGIAKFTTQKNGIRINGDKTTGKAYKTQTWEIKESTLVTKIEVYNGSKCENITLDKNIQIVIDTKAPVVEPGSAELAWTNSDSVEISGRVTDENIINGKEPYSPSSGLDYIVWSKDKSLTVKDVLTATENKVTLGANGTFSFESEKGEQDSNYYIYAVDIAGNVSEAATVHVGIDKAAPTITGFTFNTDEKRVIQEAIKFLSFGIFCNKTVYVTVNATDNATDNGKVISSGVGKIELYNGGETPFATKELENGSKKAVFELTEDEFKDGKEISATVYDNAGNKSSAKPTDKNVSSDKVKISTVEPTIKIETLKADYEQKIDNETKLWYKGSTAVKVSVSDDEVKSGIASVTINLNGTPFLEKSYGDEYVPKVSFDVKSEDGNNVIEKDGENIIEVSVTNNCGTTVTQEQKVYIDKTVPEISSFRVREINNSLPAKIINFLSFGLFCNGQVEVAVRATDANATSGIKKVTLFANDYKFESNNANKDNEYVFKIPVGELYSGRMLFNGYLYATAEDNVGNAISDNDKVRLKNEKENSTSDELMIETIAPVVSDIKASGINDSVRNNEETYSGDIRLEFTAQDTDSGLASVDIEVNGGSIKGYPISYTKAKDDDYKTTEKRHEFTTENIAPNQDGEYHIKVIAVDNCGNIGEKETIVKTDRTSPVINSFEFSSNNESVALEDVASQEEYGYYFKKDAKVKISASDNRSEFETAAGLDSITVVLRAKNGEYYTVSDDGEIVRIDEVKKAVKHSTSDSYEFVIKKSFKGQIFAFATDKVGNMPINSTFDKTPENVVKNGDLTGFKYPNGSVLETEDEHNKETHIEFSRKQTDYKTSNNVDLYAGNVPVKITVTDTYSGIKNIEWSVEAPYDTENNQGGTLEISNNGNTPVGREIGKSGWKIVEKDKNLVTKLQKDIVVKNNSNNIVVNVKMTDRAGNMSENKFKISIDKTAPKIEVTYDNNASDESYKDFFKADRTATVKITERNFNSKDVVYKIKNTDGVIPTIGKWTEHKNTEKPDETYYTAKISYRADGDYTFDISYADRADNKAEKFGRQKFTIDKTTPTVSVAYDNVSSLNGNYYKADRTATITIVEHNFDASRVNIIGTATDNGNPVTFPALSAWTDKGDTHTAVIHYSSDAKYSFDIEFRDKAGNSISDYALDEFYIDKTAPSLEIDGVADKSANKGKVAPVISFADTNYNSNAIKYTLMGVRNGKVVYDSTISNITNGQKIAFANFKKIKKVDDIYTLTATVTDMAGNETTKSVTFSVNRFGSSYSLTSIKDLLGKYLPSEEAVVFTEINVDSLKKGTIKIKLTKNGTPQDLVEGTDYTVSRAGGNGKWSQYKYMINKALFADDGRYSVSVYTVDEAGNINENIDETKKSEISFGVDKTKPVIVPIDFESGTQYPLEVKKVSVEIKDNLVLDSVKIYLNGTEIKYDNEEETYTFDIPEKSEKQNVKIVAVDAAGNTHEVPIENVLVSTNVFVRWFNNTPLFIGSIIGFVVLCAVIILLIALKRRKSKAE